MDNNNQRAMQGGESAVDGGESAVDGGGNWRNQLQSESRRRMVNEITDTLKKYFPISGQEGLQELKKVVVRFEEKIYTSAPSQGDYYTKIYMKMLALETKHPMPNVMPANSANIDQNLQDPGQLLPQNITNNIFAAGIQGSSCLSSALPLNSSSSQTNIPGASQSSKTQSMPPISVVLQNSVPSVIGQGVPLNFFYNSQKQTGRQQQGVSQQQRPQLQNSQQHLQKQQLLKQKIQSQALSRMQSHIQQQEQQQNLLQSHQLHSSQQSVMQPSMMQSSPLYNLQHNQQSSAQQSPQFGIQQHSQSARQQQQQQSSNIHQQQNTFQQQGVLPIQQQQHLLGQSNSTNVQQKQLIGQQNKIPEMQQKKQWLLSQRNNLSNQQSQQLMGLRNKFAHMHHQQLAPQEQQQHHQLVGSQHSASNFLPSQAQKSQQQMMSNQFPNVPNETQTQQQSQMMSQMQHRGLQQKLQTLQQKQVLQPQRAMAEALSTQIGNADGGDWQEETYQKIKSMKDMYFLDLNEIYQKVVAKIHQHESLLQQPQLEQGKYRKLKAFKSMLEHLISLLQTSKSNIQIAYKDKLGIYEKQVMVIMKSSYRLGKPIPHIGSGGTMQQNVSNLQHNPSSATSGISNARQSMINSLHPSSALGQGQINFMNSVQKVATGPLQQNPVSVPQQATVNRISSHSGMTSLKANLISMQPSSSMIKQEQDQLLQNQNLEQQRQQFKQTKLEQPTGIESNQSPMVDHMSDSTDSKTKQLSVKSSAFQRLAYHQLLKPGNQLPISSPQLLQPGSPPFSHHGPPQVRQQNMLIALRKAGSLLQPTNSPVVVPSASTPAVPSPMLGKPEKVNLGVSSLSKAGNVGHQTAGTVVQAQSLAIGTPGISASPLLDEFTSPEAHHAIPATVVSGKSNATEVPLERLIKEVNSMSSKALTASVCDIHAVVSMIDEIAGSTPGNGSMAAVGEDLVKMTKCPPQATNLITQDETKRRQKTKRHTTATPSDSSSTGSLSDNFKQFNGLYFSDLDSTATSTAKKPKIESGGGSFSSK